MKLLVFLTLVLAGLGLSSVALRNALDTGESGTSSRNGRTPSTVVDGQRVPLMKPVDCGSGSSGADPAVQPCNPDGIFVGDDVYVLNDDPAVEVIPANVSDTLWAAGLVGDDVEVEFAYIIENVDPAVLLAGQSGSRFYAITGPPIESTTVDPTIEVLYTVCVSLVDVSSYGPCRALAEPGPDSAPPDEPEG